MPVIKFPPEWGVEPVPIEKRELRGIDFFVLWSSLGVGLLVLQAGMLLVPSLSLAEALIISFAGSLIGSALLAAVGVVGSKYGVPTMVSLRPVLGKMGSYVPTALNIVQLIGWTAFELMVMTDSATSLSGPFLGQLTRPFWLLVFTAVVTLFAIGGPLAVVREWLEKFAIWLVYASTTWITYQVVTKHPGLLSHQGTGGLSLPIAFDLVIAMPISWLPLISDYNRFARSPTRGFLGTLLGYTLANFWFYGLGAALAVATGEFLAPASILSVYAGSLALIAILVDETDNAFADVYSTAVSLQNPFPKVRQWKFVLLASGIGAILAYAIPLAEYENFLLLIGASFVPLFGVFLSEFFLIGRKISLREFYEDAPKIRPESIISWALGFLIYWIFVYKFPQVGATLPALAASAALQFLLSRFRR